MVWQIIWTAQGINSPLTASALASNRGLPNNLCFRCEIPVAAQKGLHLPACFPLTCEFILPSWCPPSCKLHIPWLAPLSSTEGACSAAALPLVSTVCLPRRDAITICPKYTPRPRPSPHVIWSALSHGSIYFFILCLILAWLLGTITILIIYGSRLNMWDVQQFQCRYISALTDNFAHLT